MSDWLHSLPVGWLMVMVFGAAYLIAGIIHRVVLAIAAGERGRAFPSVSVAVLGPLGILFGLLVAFLAAQVWSDGDQAHRAVNREASALRSVVLLATAFPGESEARLRALVRRQIQDAVTQEWPDMARRRADMTAIPPPMAEALKVALLLTPSSHGQETAQREIVASLHDALDARRQRIIVSGAAVNWVKWSGLILQAIGILIAMAIIHSENRVAAGVALGLFATAAAVCIVLIAAHNRPFIGQLSIGPQPLLQVMPPPS